MPSSIENYIKITMWGVTEIMIVENAMCDLKIKYVLSKNKFSSKNKAQNK